MKFLIILLVLANLYYAIRKYAPDSISSLAGTASATVKGYVQDYKSWANPNMLSDAGKLLGILDAGPLVARQWSAAYPDMTQEEKILQTLKNNSGKEQIVLDNFINVIDSGGTLEGLTKSDVERIYNEYMETV